MQATADYAGPAARVAPGLDDRDLYLRLRGEFREMPGLTLTVRQAARLFTLEAAQCERVLRALVRDGVLATDGLIYACAGQGRRCA